MNPLYERTLIMAIEMTDIDKLVQHIVKETGLDFTYDNRVAVLAGLAKGFAAMENAEPDFRVRLPLDITLEIVRLRVEKQMFTP
jgi:hypothetical protein